MSTTDTSTTEAGAPPASWYPDPTGRHRLRWWDGTAWTQRVADGPEGQAPAAPAAPPVAEPEPAREPEPERAPEPEAEAGALFQPIVPEPFDPAAEAARRAEQQAQGEQAAPQEQQAFAPPAVPEPEPEAETQPTAEPEPFVGIDRPRAGRVPPAERASTGAGLDNPLPRKGLLVTIGVALIVAASLYWGWSNYESADRWRDRGEALQEELDTRNSNSDAFEEALSNSASRGAQLTDFQQQMGELRQATEATVDMINQCARTLNDLLGVTATGGDPTSVIDRANRVCGEAAYNGETLIAVLNEIQQQ